MIPLRLRSNLPKLDKVVRYLLMICIDSDIQYSCAAYVKNTRLLQVAYDIIFYTDDTILFSTSARVFNELIEYIEFYL